jgi:hypothetical protein
MGNMRPCFPFALLRRGLHLLNVLQKGVEHIEEHQQGPEMLVEAANAYESAIPEWTREGMILAP